MRLEPAASPSRPSVKLTAFEVEVMTAAVQAMQPMPRGKKYPLEKGSKRALLSATVPSGNVTTRGWA
jgi:hypothetical protein